MTLSQAIELFMLSIEATRAKGTRNYFASTFKRLLAEFGEKELAEITLQDLRKWFAEVSKEGISTSTLNHIGRSVKRLFKWLKDEGLAENTAERLEKPKQVINPKPGIGEREMLRMIYAAKAVSPRDLALLLFFADTGCRRGGIRNFRIGDLDLIHRTAYVCEKGNKTRAVFFSQVTAEALRDYLGGRLSNGESEHVFLSYNGDKSLDETGVYRAFRRIAEKAGVKERWNPHQWRHAVARGMLKKGANLAQVSQILGHKDVRVTVMYYGVFSDQDLKRAHDEYSIVRNDLEL